MRGFTKVIELNVVTPLVRLNVGKRFAKRQDVVAGDAVLRAFFIINPFHFIYFIYGKASSRIDRGTITLSSLGMRGNTVCGEV